MLPASTNDGLQRVQCNSSAHDVLQILQTDGGVIIRSLFQKQVDRFNAEIDSLIAATHPNIEGRAHASAISQTKRLTQLVTCSKVFREEMLDHERLLSYIDTMLLDTCDSYWMSTSQVIELQPGEKAQALHRGVFNYPAFRHGAEKSPEIIVTCLVALSDYTEEMGATRVLPGSHHWSDFALTGNPEDTVAATMEKGDVLIFTGKLVHGAGGNHSDRPRRALAMVFIPGWLVPEEAYAFTVPINLARTLSPRAQQLLGFRSFHKARPGGRSLWQASYTELADHLKMD